jgi:23S rRNA (pseudouridine1915-N3)-methyltransferase
MPRINIIAVGRNKDDWVDHAIGHYLKLLKKFARVDFIYIPDIKKGKKHSERKIIAKEAEAIRERVHSQIMISLADNGRLYANSFEFAEKIIKLVAEKGTCDFIIGGIYGLDNSILERCHEVVSLSPFTMSHQLIRIVLLEQLYRGFSVLSGGDYHK